LPQALLLGQGSRHFRRRFVVSGRRLLVLARRFYMRSLGPHGLNELRSVVLSTGPRFNPRFCAANAHCPGRRAGQPGKIPFASAGRPGRPALGRQVEGLHEHLWSGTLGEMSLAELMRVVASLPAEQQKELAAFVLHLRLRQDPEWRAEMARRIDIGL